MLKHHVAVQIFLSYIGHLGRLDTNRNDPICVEPPKVAKASTATWHCRWCYRANLRQCKHGFMGPFTTYDVNEVFLKWSPICFQPRDDGDDDGAFYQRRRQRRLQRRCRLRRLLRRCRCRKRQRGTDGRLLSPTSPRTATRSREVKTNFSYRNLEPVTSSNSSSSVTAMTTECQYYKTFFFVTRAIMMHELHTGGLLIEAPGSNLIANNRLAC